MSHKGRTHDEQERRTPCDQTGQHGNKRSVYLTSNEVQQNEVNSYQRRIYQPRQVDEYPHGEQDGPSRRILAEPVAVVREDKLLLEERWEGRNWHPDAPHGQRLCLKQV